MINLMKIDPFKEAMAQLDAAASKLGTKNPELKFKLESLRNPEKIIEVSFPVKMDDGKTKIFKGYRVLYNDALGPYKGGIRFHPDVSLPEVKALAFWLTVKCALMGIPMGGGKGGVVVDVKKLSEKELERLSRAYVRAVWRDIGPFVDVPAPDVNTNPQIMSWMVDEFAKQIHLNSKIKSQNAKIQLKSKKLTRQYSDREILATFTGKPLNKGGSKGRVEATGRGGLYVLQALLKKNPKSPFITVAVQGMGNVGSIFARLAEDAGFKVVALSDSKGATYSPKGLEVRAVEAFKRSTGSVAGYPNSQSLTNEELLELPVDIIVPAALEDVLTGDNASKVKAKVVLELANGPTTADADKVFRKKGIHVVPDFLANGGGVTVSYFEWFQNLKGQHWLEKAVNQELKAKVEKAFLAVWAASLDHHVDLRTAAYLVALKRIFGATKL